MKVGQHSEYTCVEMKWNRKRKREREERERREREREDVGENNLAKAVPIAFRSAHRLQKEINQ
jgi:hypothetical protein